MQLMRLAEPVLVQIMRDAGGMVILDHRQVLLRADVIDITDLAIAGVDEAIGDGTSLIGEAPTPEPDAPEKAPKDAPQVSPDAEQPETPDPGAAQD